MDYCESNNQRKECVLIGLEGRGGAKRRLCLNPLDPKIKLKILICCPYTLPVEVVGRIEVVKISSKFILCDPVANINLQEEI